MDCHLVASPLGCSVLKTGSIDNVKALGTGLLEWIEGLRNGPWERGLGRRPVFAFNPDSFLPRRRYGQRITTASAGTQC